MKKIRLWKLGYIDTKNPANSIIPTKEVIDKFKMLLEKGIRDEMCDLVWGPELFVELIEIEEDVKHYILNEDGKLELIRGIE